MAALITSARPDLLSDAGAAGLFLGGFIAGAVITVAIFRNVRDR